ncbi:MAG: hypothetical protein ACRC1K_20645 [Planctomycetia bacterium]
MTFKSYQEALDVWALEELIGHYVNHRKQLSAAADDGMPPKADFRLFAVCVRRPRGLLKRKLLKPAAPGVYQARYFTRTIRVVVVRELPWTENNAVLHLFSADPKAAK